MKNYTAKGLLSLLCLLAATPALKAQYIEDGLRLASPNLGVGARSLGLGTASIGTANDYSAMYWNPAMLGMMRTNEFSIGLSTVSYENTSSYFDTDTKSTTTSTALNNAGFVYNVPTSRGSLVFALGYERGSNFASGLSFQGFNPGSSIVQAWAPDGVSYANYDLSSNYAYQLFLANLDTVSRKFVSLINDSLTQSGKIIEGNGLNHWSFAGSLEAARNIYLGLTLNFMSGSYTYNRKYYEDDLINVYDATLDYPYDVSTLSLTEDLHSDISGFSMKFGFLANPNQKSRIGITVTTPSWMTVRETFTSNGTSRFKNGDSFIFPGDVPASVNEYKVQTPYIFAGGISFDIAMFTLAGDVEYTDWTQLEFSGSDYYYSSTFENYLNSLNDQVRDNLRSTLNLRAGAELNLRFMDTSLRGGFAYFPSPYQFDSSPNAQRYLTGGIGFLFEGSIALDFGYAYGWWETSHIMYSGYDVNNAYFAATTSEKIHTNTIIGTFSYRF